MSDARFEDGVQRPLTLLAEDAEDLTVVSALLQDAVIPMQEISWQPRLRRFALLVNRFRWEDVDGVTGRRAPERVQCLVVVDDVRSVATQGIDRSEKDVILSLLSVAFEPGTEGMGRLTFTLAGDGAIGLDVECVNVRLKDVTRPYVAPSRAVPKHAD